MSDDIVAKLRRLSVAGFATFNIEASVVIDQAIAAIERLREKERIVALSLARGMCLSDHIGDAWDVVNDACRVAGVELPYGDDGEADIDAIEAMGGVCLAKLVHAYSAT